LNRAKIIKAKTPTENKPIVDGSGAGDGENDAENSEGAKVLLSINMDESDESLEVNDTVS
jgi:hypothetical protein